MYSCSVCLVRNGNVTHCQNKTMPGADAAARAGPASVLSRRLEAGPRALTGLGLISGLCISAAQSHTPQGHHSININNADTRGVSLRGLRCPPAAAHRSRLPDVQVVSTFPPDLTLTPVTQDRPQTWRRPPRPPPQRPGAQAEAALGREEHEGGDAGQ